MNAQEIIERIRTAEKKTPVRVFLKAREPVEFPHATVFPCGETTLVFGDWKDIGPVLEEHKGDIQELVVETAGTRPSRCWTSGRSTPGLSPAPFSGSRWRSGTTR